MLACCSCAKLHWSKSALCVSMVCKCFHNSRSHFLAFLHELSKKILTISKQGVWKVLKGLKKSRTLYICFCRLPVQCILSFSCQRFLCHWNLWDCIIKSSAILNYDSFLLFSGGCWQGQQNHSAGNWEICSHSWLVQQQGCREKWLRSKERK